MAINEVFPNPTVKQVIFQIRFPNLFYIENNIGELQLKIMEMFPESSLLIRKQIVFADLGPDVKPADLFGKDDSQTGKKIWQFNSEKNCKLNVLTDSLDITSEHHKTYNNNGADKFRDVIEFVLKNFFETTKIPIINRIGLRYIDMCPIVKKDNETVSAFYNSIFPFDRFNVSEADAMDFIIVSKRKDYKLRYSESLKKIGEEYKLLLDYDGFAENIKSEDALNVTDKLHEIVIEEFEKSIKEPLIKFMKTKEE
jgi:uncharacterized protein (TIGR04255 family)